MVKVGGVGASDVASHTPHPPTTPTYTIPLAPSPAAPSPAKSPRRIGKRASDSTGLAASDSTHNQAQKPHYSTNHTTPPSRLDVQPHYTCKALCMHHTLYAPHTHTCKQALTKYLVKRGWQHIVRKDACFLSKDGACFSAACQGVLYLHTTAACQRLLCGACPAAANCVPKRYHTLSPRPNAGRLVLVRSSLARG